MGCSEGSLVTNLSRLVRWTSVAIVRTEGEDRFANPQILTDDDDEGEDARFSTEGTSGGLYL